MKDIKKNSPLREKKPVWILEKWVKKLKLEISSTISMGRTPVIKLIIRGNPLIVKRNETKIESMKAIIWLLVREEKKIPKEIYAPAIKIAPKYWPIIIKLSGFPK